MNTPETKRPWRYVADDALGWLHPAEGPALHRHALAAAQRPGPGVLVEIGGYAGKSASWIGAAAADAGRHLFSVDHHRGSPEMAPGRECHHPEMVGLDGAHDSLPHFRANMRRANLEWAVIPIAGHSAVVGAVWNTPIVFLFIDGGHDDLTVMNDALTWAPHVVPGGILAFHDTPIPGIDAAARATVDAHGFELVEQVDSLRVLRRPE